MNKSEEPNLSLLSIVLGVIENILTVNRNVPPDIDTSKSLEPIFPVIEFPTIEALYNKFTTIVKSSVDLTEHKSEYATRELVKKVSDVIWSSLTRSYYKDRAHLQSLYSFLTGNKLDCFGVAFAVVAACQILGFNDVHLVLSEDHAWVTFGKDGQESAEVTWHGKGNEDKRGQPISEGVADKSWLYLNGKPVICNRPMEVAAMVSAINPSINSTMDSSEMASLQQELLWLLHDMGYLSRYPMALGNLGDLEEMSRSPGQPPPLTLFQEGIDADKRYYDNQHVYPYTYMGAFLFRNGQYKKALNFWSNASAVMKGYNYNREDEEIYKEFLEIDNDFIPQIVRTVDKDKKGSFLRDPECYADLLRFYDGICEWEEGSSTPVLHVGWATHLVFSLSKFDPRVRQSIDLQIDEKEGDMEEDEEEEYDDEDDDEQKEDDEDGHGKEANNKIKENSRNGGNLEKDGYPTLSDSSINKHIRKLRRKSELAHRSENFKNSNNNNNNNNIETGGKKQKKSWVSYKDEKEKFEPPKLNGKTNDDQIKSAIEEFVSKAGEEGQDNVSNSNIAALAQACGESILNPDYLLGSGEPFALVAANSSSADTRVDYDEFLSTKSNGTQFIGMTVDSLLKAESPADMMMCRKTPDTGSNNFPFPTVSLKLRSKKMQGLKKILQSPKLNASAIKLQLTAQSQVEFRRNRKSLESSEMSTTTRKRLRRE